MEHEHTQRAIRERLATGPRLSYLRDWVYGGIDGTVTTFGIVTGVTGARLTPDVIVILGAANLVADGQARRAASRRSRRTSRGRSEDALRPSDRGRGLIERCTASDRSLVETLVLSARCLG